MKARKAAAQTIADRLMASEKAMDRALAEFAGLVAAMPLARLDANIAMEIGQPALEVAIDTLARMNHVRRGMIETHRRLAMTKDQIGLREVAFGGLVDKAAEKPELRIIARDAG